MVSSVLMEVLTLSRSLSYPPKAEGILAPKCHFKVVCQELLRMVGGGDYGGKTMEVVPFTVKQ